jgi:hypothetical protein
MLRVQCGNHVEMELPPGRQHRRRAEAELLARRRLRRRAETELQATRCRSWDGAAGSGTSPSWRLIDQLLARLLLQDGAQRRRVELHLISAPRQKLHARDL